MTLGMLLLIVLIVLLLGSIPTWPYSREWGYYPSGILGLVILILILFAILGYVPLIRSELASTPMVQPTAPMHSPTEIEPNIGEPKKVEVPKT